VPGVLDAAAGVTLARVLLFAGLPAARLSQAVCSGVALHIRCTRGTSICHACGEWVETALIGTDSGAWHDARHAPDAQDEVDATLAWFDAAVRVACIFAARVRRFDLKPHTPEGADISD
jgi:hypothetical protein